jgi:hypothetical protein
VEKSIRLHACIQLSFLVDLFLFLKSVYSRWQKRISRVVFYTGFRISACSMITSGSCWTFSMRAYKHSMMKKR